MYVFIGDLSKTILFLLVHRVQHIANDPFKKNFLTRYPKSLAQSLKRCNSDVGISMLNVTYTAHQINLAKWQLKKRYCIISCCEQKEHNLFPFQLHLTKLSLVNTTFLLKYHIKILILSGIFNLHNVILYTTRVSAIRALYINLTEKISFWWSPQIKESDVPFNLIWATMPTKPYHKLRLLPTSPLRKEMFNDTVLKTNATETFFFHTIAYNEGKLC
jgi:hypothetical protein